MAYSAKVWQLCKSIWLWRACFYGKATHAVVYASIELTEIQSIRVVAILCAEYQ
jgi:hypothetical protein